MDKAESLTRRAIIAVCLTIGFYLLALIVGLGIMAIPIIVYYTTGNLIIHLLVGCIATGGVILWSVIPRREQFVAPGLRLTLDKHPVLFEIVGDLAGKAGQEMPAEIYLLPDFNAYVSQRGGFVGMGGKRILGIGLGLLSFTDISELKAIVAHEFGHFYHGDTKLGPWIYSTQEAIGRTIQHLESRRSFLRKPFEWYGELFLFVTNSISQRQELLADRLAVNIAGKSAMISALKTMQRHAVAFEAYYHTEFIGVVESGFLPRLMEGYDVFLKSKVIQGHISRSIQRDERADGHNNKQTHPPISNRIRLIKKMTANDLPVDNAPSAELVGSVDEAEGLLLRALISPDKYSQLEFVQWNEVLEKVLIKDWTDQARKHLEFLGSITARQFPDIVARPENYLKAFVGKRLRNPTEMYDKTAEMGYTLGCGLVLTLCDHGWELKHVVGEEIRISRGRITFEPFSILKRLFEEQLSAEDWLKFCDKVAIEDLPIRPSFTE